MSNKTLSNSIDTETRECMALALSRLMRSWRLTFAYHSLDNLCRPYDAILFCGADREFRSYIFKSRIVRVSRYSGTSFLVCADVEDVTTFSYSLSFSSCYKRQKVNFYQSLSCVAITDNFGKACVTYDLEDVSLKESSDSCFFTEPNGKMCSNQCSSDGCWGPTDDDCRFCAGFSFGRTCVDSCQFQKGLYPEEINGTKQCQHCHEECLDSCVGKVLLPSFK